MLYESYPFELPPLPYPYDALEPYISAETLHYHHDKHFKTYVDNLNAALTPYPVLHGYTLRELLCAKPASLPPKQREAIAHNAGGVYNHSVYFAGLAPSSGENLPGEPLYSEICHMFGSFDRFKEVFTQNAKDVFGSGWSYLVRTPGGKLKIINTKNQDTPIRFNYRPIITFDVWEHAYYLDYKNLRASYIEGLWHIVKYPR
jgi:Fe-Mn family superoxide dismutase